MSEDDPLKKLYGKQFTLDVNEESFEIEAAWKRLREFVVQNPEDAFNFLLSGGRRDLLKVDITILDNTDAVRTAVQEILPDTFSSPAGFKVAKELLEMYEGSDEATRAALERRFPHGIMDTSVLPALVVHARKALDSQEKSTVGSKNDDDIIDL